MHHQHLEAGAAAGRRARMQEDPAVGIALVPANSNQMGSHIISDRCVQRSCSAKLYALRIARHGGQREQHLTRPSRSSAGKNQKTRSYGGAYRIRNTLEYEVLHTGIGTVLGRLAS